MHDGRTAVLGLVVATEGSTYAKPGAALLFGDGALRHGWISGGCLEPGLEADAQAVAASGQVRCIALDTRGDEDLLFGSRIGCRGLLHVALLPVASLRSLQAPLRAWCTRDVALQLVLTRAHLRIACSDGGDAAEAVLAWDRTEAAVPADGWTLHWPAAPRLLLFGAGPESSTLLPWLRRLGWYVDLVERRPRWRGAGALADRLIDLAPASVPVARSGYAAALVMHHDFELDREALAALAAAPPAFVGLLGPPARRDDLLSLLDAPARAALAGPLHAPVGLDLGGRGPESIALAIVAQLQARVMAVRAA
nr:XdhC/CoxI family protein [Chiayiivirga flava]